MESELKSKESCRNLVFAKRLQKVKPSFLREILKFAIEPDVISFAGGLPNPDLFPIDAINKACQNVLTTDGADALQYSSTEGYLPLREHICTHYKSTSGLDIKPENILITSGSQQALDLLAKALIDENDSIIIEKPGYLGAIQAFSIFSPNFKAVTLEEDGINLDEFEAALKESNAKFFYTVPNFHNPSGITYSDEKRQKVAEILKNYNTILIEDNPYGELRFMGAEKKSFKNYLEDQTVLLGTFSKTVAPSFRLGWIVAEEPLMSKLITVKQAADLHSNYFSQRILHSFLTDGIFEEHLNKIRENYKLQRNTMINAIEKDFPKDVKVTKPEGGMFLWVTLPKGFSSLGLFDIAIKKRVAFVPGFPFYVENEGENTLRLNYSNSDPKMIEVGIKRLGDSIKELLAS